MTVPDLIVSDAAILAAARVAEGSPEMTLSDLAGLDVRPDEARPVFAAAAPHIVRDWVQAVLAQYPYITPALLSDLADDLLTGGNGRDRVGHQ